MKTEKPTSDPKSEIIQKFTSVLNQHCRDERDVWGIIEALQDASKFMHSALYSFDLYHGFYARHIRKHLAKAPEHILKDYDNMDDTVSSALIISGQNASALYLIDTVMRDDLDKIADEFNA